MSSTLMLLTKILESTEHFMDAKRRGINERNFIASDEQMVWALVDVHFSQHTNIPPYDHITKLVPGFTPVDPGKRTVSELVAKVRNDRAEIEIRTAMAEVEAYLAKEKYSEAISRLHLGASTASQGWGLSRDVSISKNAEDVLFAYLDTKERGIMRGIPWPWDPMNQASGGILPGTYSVLYGRAKSTKTFRLLEVATRAQQAGKRVLVVSCEMMDQSVMKRLVAVECAFDYDKFSKGTLSDDEEFKLQEYVLACKERSRQHEIVVTQLTDGKDGKTVSALRSKIDEHEPDLILVDSIYKMRDEKSDSDDSSPQTMRNISSSLQQLAQMSKIPVVVTTQANRSGTKAKAGETSDVAFSDALAMDCDVLMRLVNDAQLQRTVFMINAAREIVLDGFSAGNRMCDGMGPVSRPDGTFDWDMPAKYRPGAVAEVANPAAAAPSDRFNR